MISRLRPFTVAAAGGDVTAEPAPPGVVGSVESSSLSSNMVTDPDETEDMAVELARDMEPVAATAAAGDEDADALLIASALDVAGAL